MADMGIFDPEIGDWRPLTPADLAAVINAENISLEVDPQSIADGGGKAPTDPPAEGSSIALLGRIASAAESTDPVPVLSSAGIDSGGDPLPPNFDSYASTYGWTSGKLTTEVKSIGGSTYTKTFSYTDGNLTTESAWVKS